MAATDQQIADSLADSLLRVVDTDSASWKEGEREQQLLDPEKMYRLKKQMAIDAVRSGGTIFRGVKRVNV
jgi:hypothetical protein